MSTNEVRAKRAKIATSVKLPPAEKRITNPFLTPKYAGELYAAEIHEQLKGKSLPEPNGYNVLIAIFVRPKVTAGGIHLADQTVQEDEFQGRAGLVLAVGPDAYAEDKFRKFSGAWVKPGDWVIWPLLENAATRFKFGGGVVLAVLPDDKMLAKVANPMDVY